MAWNEDMARRHDPDLYHTASPLPVRLLERQRVSRLLRQLAAKAHHRVLEVGCGAGNVLERVPGRRVGVDISPFLLGKARRRLGPSAPLLRMNAEHLAFRDGSFDRIYCSEVLEHVLEPRAALAEMRRVLRPGGRVVVSVPNEALINRVKGAVLSVPGARALLSRVSDYEMADHMEDEWHLHEYDADLLHVHVAGLFRIEHLGGVPHPRFALRLVATLAPL